MERSANNGGRMTVQRADAIKAFVRQSEDMANGMTARAKDDSMRMEMSAAERKWFGMALIEETIKGDGSVDKIREILDKGADVNAADSLGRTALMWAARRSHANVIETLVNSGARIDIRTNDGSTVFDYIVDEDIEKLLEDLTEGRSR